MPISSPLTIEAFSIALNRNLTEMTRNVYERAPAEYTRLAKVESTKRWFDEFQNVQGIGRPTLNRDLEPLPQVTPQTGYRTLIRQQSYRSQLTVEETFIRVSDHKQVFDNVEDMVESVKTLKDASVASFFNSGFTDSLAQNITETDGTARAFFSTGHYYEGGGSTYSNYYNVLVPPNPETVYLICQQYLGTLKDNVGNYINWQPQFTIVTPRSRPDWGLAADEIVASQDRPDTTNRAVNVLNGGGNMNTSVSLKLNHVSLNNLSSTSKWFVIVSPNNRAYPLRLRELLPYEVTPLQAIGPANPHAFVMTNRCQFGTGFVGSYRGAVAIGT
jgi:hypothetical protein